MKKHLITTTAGAILGSDEYPSTDGFVKKYYTYVNNDDKEEYILAIEESYSVMERKLKELGVSEEDINNYSSIFSYYLER